MPDMEILFLDKPLGARAMRMTRLVWFIKEMPLATKHYLVDLTQKRIKYPDEPVLARDPRVLAFNMAADAVGKAWDQTVAKNVQARPGRVHPFEVGLDDSRQGHVAAPGRIFLRTEPLQFPEYFPPHGRTHAHGRYVRHHGQSQPVWVDYENQGPDAMLLLPPN